MRNKHYPKREFRISDEVYEELQKRKQKDDVTWNLLFKQLIEYRKEK